MRLLCHQYRFFYDENYLHCCEHLTNPMVCILSFARSFLSGAAAVVVYVALCIVFHQVIKQNEKKRELEDDKQHHYGFFSRLRVQSVKLKWERFGMQRYKVTQREIGLLKVVSGQERKRKYVFFRLIIGAWTHLAMCPCHSTLLLLLMRWNDILDWTVQAI